MKTRSNKDQSPQQKSSQPGEPRCLYHTPSGRRCRAAAPPGAAGLCERHALAYVRREDPVVTAALAADAKTFLSAKGINHSLVELHALLVKDLISPRRAAVLAYISSLLLRTLGAIEDESAAKAPDKRPVQIIFDMPHPPHEDGYKP
jgi:hypothetical protein